MVSVYRPRFFRPPSRYVHVATHAAHPVLARPHRPAWRHFQSRTFIQRIVRAVIVQKDRTAVPVHIRRRERYILPDGTEFYGTRAEAERLVAEWVARQAKAEVRKDAKKAKKPVRKPTQKKIAEKIPETVEFKQLGPDLDTVITLTRSRILAELARRDAEARRKRMEDDEDDVLSLLLAA